MAKLDPVVPPRDDAARYRLYVRWAVLDWLYENAVAGRTTVSSGELQAFLKTLVDSRAARYGLVKRMVEDQEIGILNRQGRSNQRFMLRAGRGEEAMKEYRDALKKKGKE